MKKRQSLEEDKDLKHFTEMCTNFKTWIKDQDDFVRKALGDSSNRENSKKQLTEYDIRAATGEKQMRTIADAAKKLVQVMYSFIRKI